MAKGEITCFEQFLLLSVCFQNAVCCRGVRKRLYEGKRVKGEGGQLPGKTVVWITGSRKPGNHMKG